MMTPLDRLLDRALNLPAPVRLGLFAGIVIAVFTLGYLTLQTDPSNGGPTNPETGAVVTVKDPALNGNPEDATEFATDPTSDVELQLTMPVADDELKIAAGRAVRFAELMTSYRYDQHIPRKQAEVESLLAAQNTIDVTKAFQPGPAQASLKASQTVVGAQVTRAEAVLVAKMSIALNLTLTTTTTTTEGAQPPVETAYTVTLSKSAEPERPGWHIVDFTPIVDTTFQDMD